MRSSTIAGGAEAPEFSTSPANITARLPLGVEGVLDGSLPAALPPTVYALYGNYLALGLWLLVLMASQVFRRRS